jgi:hypothetical protein
MELFDPISLLSRPLNKPAQTRNWIGDIAARFAAEAMRLQLLPIQQHKEVCPDFQFKGLHGEIKSVGKNGRALLYKWRVEKEARNFNPESYLYIFVLHDCPIGCRDLSEITAQFSARRITLHCVTLAELQAIVSGIEPRKFSMFNADHNPRIGYNRPGYSDGGWQFSVKLLPESGRPRTRKPTWLGQPKRVGVHMSDGWLKALSK